MSKPDPQTTKRPIGVTLQLTDAELDNLWERAVRDDAHQTIVGSEIRHLIAQAGIDKRNLLPSLPEGWMLITLNGFSGGFQAEIFHFDQGKQHGCGPTPRSAVIEAIEGKHHHG